MAHWRRRLPAGVEQTRDGRSVRAERTRTAIVDALLSLLDEGDVKPTAERVASRAKVSERSVFQHFSDREALFEAAAQRQFERVIPKLVSDTARTRALPADRHLRRPAGAAVRDDRRRAPRRAPDRARVGGRGQSPELRAGGQEGGGRAAVREPKSRPCRHRSAMRWSPRWPRRPPGPPGRACASTRAWTWTPPAQRCAAPWRPCSARANSPGRLPRRPWPGRCPRTGRPASRAHGRPRS